MFAKRLSSLRAYKTETSPARIKLSSNELPYELPLWLRERVSEELKRVPLNRYPDPGAQELKEVIGEFFGVPPENISLGNGSDELIYYLSLCIGEPEEAVYIPVPTFPMYEIASEVFGRPVAQVRLKEDFEIPLEESLEAVEKHRAVIGFYSYPNNPTGNLFSRESIEKLRERGVFTVVDEAYYNYSSESFLEDALTREDTVVLRTLSKIGLAGLRVGMLIGRREVVEEIEKVRLPFNTTYPSQVIAKVVLKEGKEFIETSVKSVIEERERVFKELNSIKGVKAFPSRANFILFKSNMPAGELHSKLLSHDVLVRDMSHLPGLEGCLRVSIGKPQENEIFLEAMHNIMR